MSELPAGDPRAPRRTVVTLAGARDGIVDAAAPFVGVVVFGFALGALAAAKEVPFAQLLAMSASVFAGASQVAAIELWDAPLPVGAIVVGTLALNLRLVLMSATLVPWLKGLSRPAALATCHLIVDEGWALSLRRLRAGSGDVGYLVGIGLLYWCGWLVATAAGHVAGAAIAAPERLGLDFLGVAVFLALLMLIGPRRTDLLAILAAVAVTGVALVALPAPAAVLLGALGVAAAGATCSAGREQGARAPEARDDG